jgi:DNA-binding PadR family transcriptional regulator
MRLPTTSYILLGMLSSQELSGYDMKLLLDKHIHHIYWSPAKSQIYGELRRLEREGLTAMTIPTDVPPG